MQSSTGGPRIKLNRNAFKTEHEPVPKRQRLLRSETAAPDAKVHATRSGARDARPQEPDVGIPAAAPDQVRNGCTHRNCRNKNNNCCTNNDGSHHKQIRCHLHLALRFCKAKSARPPEDASGTTRDAIKPHAGSGGESVRVNKGVNKPRVETQNIHTGAPEKEDGRAAHRRSNFNRKAGMRRHFGSISRLGSRRQVKRSVKNSCCALCGDIKYTPPACKKIAHACRAKSRCLNWPERLERTMVHSVAQSKMTTRLLIWFRRHLKVKLCDLAHVFDVTSRDFSCILPAVLLRKRKHKQVKCFSQEFRSLMRVDPEGSGKWIGSQLWEVCTPTNSCASLSSGSPVGERISDSAEDIERCSESSDKHRKTRSSIDSTTSVPLDPGEVQHCAETAGYETQDSSVAFEGEKFTAGPVHHVPPLLLRRVPVCKAFASSQYVDFANKFTPKEADTNDTCLVENELNDGSEGDVDSPECFSCQRTTAYVLWPRESCARTYKSWPFPRHGPPCELMTSSSTGPRWIVTSKTSDGTEISNMQVDFNGRLECTVEKNTKESLASHNGSVAIQKGQEQVQSQTQSARVLASSAQNNPEQLTVVNNQGERIQNFCNGFSQDLPRLGSVNENDPQAVDIRFPDVMTEEKDNVTPAELITAKSYDFNDSPRNRTQCSISSKRPEDNENRDTESTSVHHLVPVPDHQQSAFHTSSCTVHSTEELQNPTMMASSSEEPKHPSSVMEPPKDEQMSNNDVEDRIPCSLNVLHTEPIDQNTSFPTCTGGINLKTPFQSVTNKDSFSLSDEEITNLSAAKRPEEANVESLLLQNELHQIDKAKRSPSPVLAQVVTGGNLDVVRAYEDDAIVLDVIHDDPDLFGAIVTGTPRDVASKANPAGGHSGKNTCMQTKRTSLARKPNKINWDFDSETPRKNVQAAGGDDVRMENPNGFCRGEKKELAKDFKRQLSFGTKWPPGNPIVTQEQMVPDCNNNQDKTGLTLTADARDSGHTTAGNGVNVVKHLPSPYCWYYFSEYHSCLRTTCWFSHVPREEDEKFCIDVVQKFCRVGSPPVVQRAVEVFVAYYRTNAPGPSFSQNTANQLLTSLLNLALLRDLVSVINTLITHKRTPSPEFVMALYEHVYERGIQNFVPELILLTLKVVEVGCAFSVEQCEMMQFHLEALHVPRHQMEIFLPVKCRALANNPHTAKLSDLAQAVVRVELCKQKEDWLALSHVFSTVCGGRHSKEELSRFCCRVTMALLKEPKDKLTLPYQPFAESVCQDMASNELVKCFLGRIGVSLMYSYHRAQDWSKGVKLLSTIFRLQLEFNTLKGLFSSESGASRCQHVSVATEFFLNSGSIEGALNTLKANEWFVSSSAWPCEQADVQNRRRVLTLLAEKTSYRDTLEVLSNLPGLKQPVDGVQASEYETVFNAHLRKCVTNQVLPVAADTFEFMLTHKIPPDTSELQQLVHKLGKQNSWIRARTLFKRALLAGYYSGVAFENDSLALPCCLTEIEMTLAFEMFVTCICHQNPTDASQPLLITLKRRTGSEVAPESVYLAAGCRLLSAARIPNPKLSIRYTAVTQEQEQLFKLDRGSAAKWLSHNCSWAQRMWAGSHTHTLTHTQTNKPSFSINQPQS